MKRKLTVYALLISMLASIGTGCAQETASNSAEAVQPNSSAASSNSAEASENVQANSEPVKIKGWGAFTFNDTTGISSYEQQMSWQEIEKKLNIDIEWDVVTQASGNAATQFGLIMASGDLPDFFTEVDPMHAEEFGGKGSQMLSHLCNFAVNTRLEA